MIIRQNIWNNPRRSLIHRCFSGHARLWPLRYAALFVFFFAAAPAFESFAADAEEFGGAAPIWQPLAQRLAKDGIAGARVDELLKSLGPKLSQSPMGRKILELYNKKFFPPSKKTSQPLYYKGVVTKANALLCQEYIKEHQAAFSAAQSRYGTPPAIISALLFVETRLGKVLGDTPKNALFTLASMASSTVPQDISAWLPKLRGYQKHLPWIAEMMRKRSEWAYNETKALLAWMIKTGTRPDSLPCSIYGAVGICQFMPSNISRYGADGDGDGQIDLYSAADAIASAANYLHRHGWREGIDPAKQRKLLMSYNNSLVYANTILALGSLVTDSLNQTDDTQAGEIIRQ